MPTIIVEGRYASDWLKAESHNSGYSREEIIVASGSCPKPSSSCVA